jgi:hypothetical protein
MRCSASTSLATACFAAGVVQGGLLLGLAGFDAAGIAAGALVAAGLACALGPRALARAPATVAMVSIGGLGMLLGWWADLGFRTGAAFAEHARMPIDTIWCRAPAGPAALAGLPALGIASWMDLGMLAFGVPASLAAGGHRRGGTTSALVCGVAMLVGMRVGCHAASSLGASFAPPLAVLVDYAGMMGGMAIAMALVAQIPRQAAIATSAQPSTVTRKPAAPA